MKKVVLLATVLFAVPAFAQLPPLPVPLPSLPSLPAAPALTGTTTVTANGMGVIVTVDSSQTPPATVTPVGLPALPDLP